jgi:iron complex outermembrane receptor protein
MNRNHSFTLNFIMNKFLLCVTVLFCAVTANSQHTIGIRITDGSTKEPIPGATVVLKPGGQKTLTDSLGMAKFINVPAGNFHFIVSHVSFSAMEGKLVVPIGETIEVAMEAEEEEEDEVIIQSTRSSRTIRDIPTRVEFIAGEELDEKANMKPGDIRMVLTESTGIQTQQTSATSANASIRIQGLDGRYTQVLKDGFPVYAGFSSGLGLLQTPPLDLQQFEVIKGSASTLYGAGAIAGLVNLISKRPGEERELKFHFDFTSALGLNTSGFYSEKFGKTGLTIFASRNSNAPYDPADIGLTAIPKFERYTLNPKLFIYIKPQTELSIAANLTTEVRTGGEVAYIKGNNPGGFFEKNNTDRNSIQLNFEHRFGKCSHITVKHSLSRFDRGIHAHNYLFDGRQVATFTEMTYASHGDISEWVTGINVVTDDFKEVPPVGMGIRDYNQFTLGGFVQNNLKVNDRLTLEAGLRGDHVRDYGFALLPRLSALFKFTPKLSSRVGGGLGYKTPNLFTEESERLLYRNVLAVDKESTRLEKSYGLNADINYRTKIFNGQVNLSINHLFFYTRIDDPLLLQPFGSDYRFNTIDGHIDSKGMETNIKAAYGDFKLFLGYTFTNAYLHDGNLKTESYLTPKHRVNSVLMYEVEDQWKIGLEAYYFDKQKLSDGATGRSYWVTGFMVEKLWEKISVYINFENFLDARQTRFDTIYTGTLPNPVFRDIYAPLDGFVINGGVKLRL